jgi:hypothetical protein
MTSPSTRRQFLTRAALAAPVIGVLGGISAADATAAGSTNDDGLVARAQATPTAGQTPVGEATAPGWRFTVLQFADPYAGEISKPANRPAGTRFVGAEVVITNGSDQPLDFSTADVRLRDVDGVEYAAGPVVGEEPRLASQNLPEGERTRGWVWYAVPEASALSELRLVGPSPVFRVTVVPS